MDPASPANEHLTGSSDKYPSAPSDQHRTAPPDQHRTATADKHLAAASTDQYRRPASIADRYNRGDLSLAGTDRANG